MRKVHALISSGCERRAGSKQFWRLRFLDRLLEKCHRDLVLFGGEAAGFVGQPYRRFPGSILRIARNPFSMSALGCWQQMTFPATLIDKIRQLPKSENLDLGRLDSRVETWGTRRWYSLLQVTGQCCKVAWSLRDSPLGGRKNNLPVYENKMAVISVFSGSRSGMWTGSCMESTVLPEPGQRRKAGYEGRWARIERRGQRRGARRETGNEEGLPQDETWHKEGLA